MNKPTILGMAVALTLVSVAAVPGSSAFRLDAECQDGIQEFKCFVHVFQCEVVYRSDKWETNETYDVRGCTINGYGCDGHRDNDGVWTFDCQDLSRRCILTVYPDDIPDYRCLR